MIRMPMRVRRTVASPPSPMSTSSWLPPPMPPARRCRGKRRSRKILQSIEPRRQDRRGHHHHRDRPRARVRRRRAAIADPDRVRPVDPAFAASSFFLSFFYVRRRGARLMAVAFEQLDVAGDYCPVHRYPDRAHQLGGAPRSIAILNRTLAGAVGLGLRLYNWSVSSSGPSGTSRRSGPPSAIPHLCRSRKAASARPRPSRGLREATPMMNLAELYSRTTAAPPCRFPALGRARRRRRRAQQG